MQNKKENTLLNFETVGRVAQEIAGQTGLVVTVTFSDHFFELSAGEYSRRCGDLINWYSVPESVKKEGPAMLGYDRGRRDGIAYEKGRQAAGEAFSMDVENKFITVEEAAQTVADGITALVKNAVKNV